MGGAIGAIDYMKSRLVDSNADRLNRIEAGETVVVGVNKFQKGETSPLMTGDGGIMVVDPAVEQEQIARLNDWRNRDSAAVEKALADLRAAAANGDNVMPASIAAAKAGVTTGEWAAQMRTVHGEYRGPTGVSGAPSNKTEGLDDLRSAVDAVSDKLGRRLKFVIGKPGLDGHSNGAEQIAFRARDCGMDITYDGIRLTPEEIVAKALGGRGPCRGPVDPVRLSHPLGRRPDATHARLAGWATRPVIVGGIIPDEDADRLRAMGVARVYTPKDFELNTIMGDIVTLGESRHCRRRISVAPRQAVPGKRDVDQRPRIHTALRVRNTLPSTFRRCIMRGNSMTDKNGSSRLAPILRPRENLKCTLRGIKVNGHSE